MAVGPDHLFRLAITPLLEAALEPVVFDEIDVDEQSEKLSMVVQETGLVFNQSCCGCRHRTMESSLLYRHVDVLAHLALGEYLRMTIDRGVPVRSRYLCATNSASAARPTDAHLSSLSYARDR